MSIKADLLSDGASRSRQYHVLLSESDGASRRHVGCRTALRAADGVMSHHMNLTALRAVMSNLHVGYRTALRAVVPMSGVGQNLLQIRGGRLFFTLKIWCLL